MLDQENQVHSGSGRSLWSGPRQVYGLEKHHLDTQNNPAAAHPAVHASFSEHDWVWRHGLKKFFKRFNYYCQKAGIIPSPATLHKYKADNKLKVLSAATISDSVTVALTVRRRWTKLIGSFQHVLAQQLAVGHPGGKLLLQLVIDELLYSCTWITSDKETVVKWNKPSKKHGCFC